MADHRVEEIMRKLGDLEKEKETYKTQLETVKEKVERENSDE